MARIMRVDAARKPQGKCGHCHQEIPVGAPYIWVKQRFQAKRVRCTAHACRFRPSELTTSEIRSLLYGAQESWEDLDQDARTQQEAESITESCQEACELIQEKMDNIESGCGHTGLPVYEELEERLGELESWVEELRELVEEWGCELEEQLAEEVEDEEEGRDWVEEFTEKLWGAPAAGTRNQNHTNRRRQMNRAAEQVATYLVEALEQVAGGVEEDDLYGAQEVVDSLVRVIKPTGKAHSRVQTFEDAMALVTNAGVMLDYPDGTRLTFTIHLTRVGS